MAFDQALKPDGDQVAWLPVVIRQGSEAALVQALEQAKATLAQAKAAAGSALSFYLPTAFAPNPAAQQASLPWSALGAGSCAAVSGGGGGGRRASTKVAGLGQERFRPVGAMGGAIPLAVFDGRTWRSWMNSWGGSSTGRVRI